MTGGRGGKGGGKRSGGGSAKGRGGPAKGRSSGGRRGVGRPAAGGAGTGSGRAPTGGHGRVGAGGAAGASPERRRQAGPKGLGGDQVEGRQAVRELLVAGRRQVRDVLVAAAPDDQDAADLVELARQVGATVRRVSRAELERTARTERPQGVVARAVPLPEVDFEALMQPSRGVDPFLLVLDGITDPQNLGAILRSAECAGVTGVVLPRHRAVHVTPAVTKAAAGAVEHVAMALVGGVPAALADLREHDVWVVGMDAGGDVDLADLPAGDGPIALVLGAEGRGLSRLARQRCDALVAIPMLGQLASLNVSVAAALGCFEVARRRLAAGMPRTSTA
ncbi:MAG: 23S rRNA (guanosine(2251)-2'-O)-methyltransferase RlmB [Acidimicrobiia bacterium]|nr:23S rRNA (guanosine(2251)-2'-O)-methyltransferase RlmB [Acidimicrobiia bacterium]